MKTETSTLLLKLFNESVDLTYTTEKETPTDNSNTNLTIDPELKILNQEKNLIDSFLTWIQSQLELEALPKIHILEKRHDGMTYGAFDIETEEILAYGKNRGLADILRTIAHEIVHYWQKKKNLIPNNLTGRDLAIEGEANAKAGDFIYMFGLEHPEIYEIGDTDDTIEVLSTPDPAKV